MHTPKKLSSCPNCQTSLEQEESYCPTCGQKNEDIILPVSYHLKDAVESVFNWDSRLLRTLRVMFTKPGALTLQFNQGKRKTYVPPFRLYLIVSILFFLLFSITSKKEIEQVDTVLEEIILSRPDTIPLSMGLFRIKMTSLEITKAKTFSSDQIDSVLVANEIAPTLLNHLSFKQTIRMMTGSMTDFFNSLTQVFSTGMFLLMPVFALLLMLIFFRQKKYYVEHLIGSIHLHTLAFIIFSLNIIIEFFIPNSFSVLIAFLIVLSYVYLYVKNIYDKKWLPAFFYFGLLITLYLIILPIALIGFGLIGLLIF